MSFLVVDVDGGLHIRDATPTAETIRAEVGDMDQVRLDEPFRTMRGWVNDTGFRDDLPRNVVGSLMLMSCFGPEQPYAGPIVITGWHPFPSSTSEIRPLTADLIKALRQLHGCITATLAGDHSCDDCTKGWRGAVLELAEVVRTAPTPEIQRFPLGRL